MLVTLPEAKEYLRLDGDAEDMTVSHLLGAAYALCLDVARLDAAEFDAAGDLSRVAVLYALAYLYEHREEADHHALALTLRNLLHGIRKEAF